MKKTRLIYSTLSLILVMIFIMPLAIGCPSSTTNQQQPAPLPGQEPAPLPGQEPAPRPAAQGPIPSNPDDIEPNEAVIFCQVQLFGEWDGDFPRTMTVMILETNDVEGKVNYTTSFYKKQIDVTIDEDIDWLMLGNQITCNVELRATPDGGTGFYIWNLIH